MPASCRRVAVAPATDQPAAAELAALRGCDAEALYYGIGAPPDAVRARACAFAERAKNESPIFGGAGVLMMIYANGKGVARNLDVATAFACELGGAPAELEGRLSHIERLRDETAGAAELDICDDVTSGYMSGQCAEHRERMDSVRRNERKRKAAGTLPGPQFAILDRSAHDFFSARERAEIDHSGTLRSALQIAEHAALEDAYAKALAQVTAPGFPPPADAAATEAELDAIYLKLMRCPGYTVTKETLPGAVTSNGIRDTQRLWREYRDAWIELGTKARSGTSADAWKAFVTRERIDMLKRLEQGC